MQLSCTEKRGSLNPIYSSQQYDNLSAGVPRLSGIKSAGRTVQDIVNYAYPTRG